MQLQKEVKKEPNAKISVHVTVGKDSISEAQEEIIRDFEVHAKIPGFRKGKIPRNIVLTRFSDSIKNETISTVLSRSLEQVLKEEGYRPISDPVVTEIGELITEEDFTFKAEFDIMPEVVLPEYKGITSERFVYTVSKDSIHREIESLRERFARLLSVDREAKIGDYVLMDYAELTPNGNRKNEKKNQTIFLDDRDDQLAKQLLGLKKGDEKEFAITHTYTEEGKEKEYIVHLQVKVHDVKEKELPELNDDFAKDISDVETLDELQKKVKELLEKEAASLAEERTKAELLQKIIQKTSFELPVTLINSEVDRLLNEVLSAYKIDLEKLKKNEQQYAEYRKSIEPRAKKNLQQELILAELAKKEKLEPTEKEIDEEIASYAEKIKKEFASVKQSMLENRSIDNLKYRLRLNKALEILYTNAHLEKVRKLKYEEEIEGGNA